jgi:hypothetical protein
MHSLKNHLFLLAREGVIPMFREGDTRVAMVYVRSKRYIVHRGYYLLVPVLYY